MLWEIQFEFKIQIDMDHSNILPLGPRGGNQAGRAGPKPGRAKILTAQPVLKTGLVGSNSLFKAKKNSCGLGRAGHTGRGHTGRSHTGRGHIGPGQIWPDFFLANNLMAQPGPNSGRTGLAHRVGQILPPLLGPYTTTPIIRKN